MNELQRIYQEKALPGESARTRRMALLEAYYLGTQYDALPSAWDECMDTAGQPIPFRLRRPSTVVPLPKLIVNTFKRALWAADRRPRAVLKGPGNEAANADIAALIDESGLYRVMGEATRRALVTGTGVVAWKFIDGRYSAEAWDAKWCQPTFKPGAFPTLEAIEQRFPFQVERDGRTVTMWHREVITAAKWTVYQDVEVTADQEPKWNEDAALSVDHGLGFVPAVWFIVGERQGPWDGTGVYADSDVLSLFDDANFTASQQARSLHYNLDPQLVITGVSEVDVDQLRKGGANTWPLPHGAEAKLLESNGEYVRSADTRLDSLRRWVLDAAAVVINDPERIKGAQSGSALELLNAPMLAHVSDLREDVGDCAFKPLLAQMLRRRRTGKGEAALVLHWGAMSPSTTEDARGATEAATKAVEAGIMSKAAAARYLAPYVGVNDVEGDQAQADDEATDGRNQLEAAAAVDLVDIPSPTFQALYKAQLAAKVLRELGEDVSDAVIAAIKRELELNLSSEDLADKRPRHRAGDEEDEDPEAPPATEPEAVSP
jgi:hypothetical protein